MSSLKHDSIIIPGLIQDIDIHHIRLSNFCRQTTITADDNLQSLSNSIKQKGLLQPIIVRSKENHFEIVAGNRRYNACKYLGWRKISCHIVELDDKESFEVSIIENIQRKTLNPIDEAHAFKKYVYDLGWGGLTELALKIGKSTSYVSKRIRLLDLPPEVLDSMTNFQTPVSVLEELESITDISKQTKLANIISVRKLSLRKARKLIRDDACVDSKNNNSSYIPCYDFSRYQNTANYYASEKTKRSFDKTIIALRVAMSRLAQIIESIDDNWIVYEILMQHRNMLHAQIDLLIKEKKKMYD